MKKIVIVAMLLMPAIAFTQPNIEKIIRQEHNVGNNWVTDFKRTTQWDLVATIMVANNDQKIMIDSSNKRDYYYRFNSDSLFSNRTANGTITYFPQHLSFYINPVPSEDNQMLNMFSPFRIHYLDASYVVVERIYRNFDVYTGRILTDEEAKVLLKEAPAPDVKIEIKQIKKPELQRHFELWSRHG